MLLLIYLMMTVSIANYMFTELTLVLVGQMYIFHIQIIVQIIIVIAYIYDPFKLSSIV